MDEEYLMEVMQRSSGRSYSDYENRKEVYNSTGNSAYYDDPMERLAAGIRESTERMFGKR